mgnify:CR=1 FL=1
MDAAEKAISEAYVDPEERVLDPSLLEKSVLERMPQPTGWRILVLPYGGKQKTKVRGPKGPARVFPCSAVFCTLVFFGARSRSDSAQCVAPQHHKSLHSYSGPEDPSKVVAPRPNTVKAQLIRTMW